MKKILFTVFVLILSTYNIFAQEVVYNPQRILWDANTESDLAGYSLYISEDNVTYEKLLDISLSDLKNIDKPEYLFDFARVEGEYSVYVNAYDLAGNEGGHDNIAKFIFDFTPPTDTQNIRLRTDRVVFEKIDDITKLRMSENLLKNADFEKVTNGIFDDWGDELAIPNNDHSVSPITSAYIISELVTLRRGLYQRIDLNQTEAKSIFFGGYGKSDSVTGGKDQNYSIYLDIYYNDDSNVWGRTVQFPVGTNDWEYHYNYFIPDKPIKTIHYTIQFRSTHTGAVWFDDMVLKEIEDKICIFDDVLIYCN